MSWDACPRSGSIPVARTATTSEAAAQRSRGPAGESGSAPCLDPTPTSSASCCSSQPDVRRGPSMPIGATCPPSPRSTAAPSATPRSRLERWLASMRADRLAPSTVARRVSAVRSYLRHLVLIGNRADNPAASLQLPRRARTLPRALSPSEAERLIDAATGSSRDPYATARSSSCSMEQACASPRRSGSRKQRRPRRASGRVARQGDKERLVPLGRPAAESVRRYLALGRPHLDRRYRPSSSSMPGAVR